MHKCAWPGCQRLTAGRYCSHACSNRGRYVLPKPDPLPRACQVCGGKFVPKPGAAGRYCSHRCAGVASRGPAHGGTCRHCGRHKVSRPRGLCHTCYCKKSVRDLYPPFRVLGGGPGGDDPAEIAERARLVREGKL